MWMDMSRRALSWLPVLTACCTLWVIISGAGPGERRVHAFQSAAAGPEASAPAPTEREISNPPTATERKAPDKAYALLEALKQRNGDTLPGYVGGKVFQNRERRLPRGRYKEYDVNRRVPGRSRDGERLVIEQDTGKAYYTNDHYRTFLPLN
jgi:ribonuclease T1